MLTRTKSIIMTIKLKSMAMRTAVNKHDEDKNSNNNSHKHTAPASLQALELLKAVKPTPQVPYIPEARSYDRNQLTAGM